MKKKVFWIVPLLFFVQIIFAQPKYEFRGVWIATVSNIDWPKHGDWNSDHQKADFIRILDEHKKNGMNAVIVQIRPAADAFYPSSLEPWSQWLTGQQGKAPEPYYDPLKFMIEETHKRGMEFHAWLNPYRAVFNIRSSSIAPNHITRQHPEWFLTYGDKKYFDPGNKEAQKFVVKVVRDIVKRYDVDAIHMDDYFYPYRIPGKEFPDDATYRNAGTSLNKDDWRRSNTDSIIRDISIAIKEENKYCKFGISPFSVWRNKDKDPVRGSDSRAGQTNYDDLYADILLWLQKGWIDYVTPQLYLAIGNPYIDYAKLLDWWSRNSYGRHIYIGHGIYRVGSKEKAWDDPNELPNQIKLLRRYPNVQGSVFYSSSIFDKNPNGWNDSLRNNYYKYPALIPPMPWIDREKPWPPIVERKLTNDSIIQLTVKPDPRNLVPIKYYVVYQYAANSQAATFGNIPKYISRIVVQPDGFVLKEALSSKNFSYRYLITAVGKNNNESDLSEIAIVVQPNGKWDFYKP
ncbi:MAG: family 10 glycosylhydrolase [Chitinophagaceae bacterium]|nr:family 10 glycosylhydrolase [Chitinophagaceae bacterium]HQV05373.1 family 10 glycosylhydrolase [Chitinophagaceae bacterium]